MSKITRRETLTRGGQAVAAALGLAVALAAAPAQAHECAFHEAKGQDAHKHCTGGGGRGGGGGRPLVLTNSGPVSASADSEVIENLRITADCEVGIRVDGHVDVTIRNVEIHHSCTHGIAANFADGLTIQDVRIVRTDVPQAGPAPTIGNNIHIANSDNIRVTRAQLWRGSSGFWSVNSFDAQLRFIEGHDFRGPFPRGQLAQFDKSPSCLLENFSAENPLSTSWTTGFSTLSQSSAL